MLKEIQPLTGTLTSKEIRHLNPIQKEQYANNLILEVLRKNRKGMSISTICTLTKLYRNTVERHLTRLMAIQVVEREMFGITAKYKLIPRQPTRTEMEIDFSDDVFYSLQVMNRDGMKELYVQQKELDELRKVVVKGGVTVRFEDFDTFIEQLKLYMTAQRGGEIHE